MDIKTVALILLLGRLISASFMVMVVKRQYALSKLPIDPELLPFRKTLNLLALSILIGITISIVLDAATIIAADSLQREDTPSVVGVMYGIFNCLTSIVSAFLIWTLYKQAAKTVLIVDQATEDALHNKK